MSNCSTQSIRRTIRERKSGRKMNQDRHFEPHSPGSSESIGGSVSPKNHSLSLASLPWSANIEHGTSNVERRVARHRRGSMRMRSERKVKGTTTGLALHISFSSHSLCGETPQPPVVPAAKNHDFRKETFDLIMQGRSEGRCVWLPRPAARQSSPPQSSLVFFAYFAVQSKSTTSPVLLPIREIRKIRGSFSHQHLLSSPLRL